MGIVVPSAARAPNDSVDALLEGIRRERSEHVGTPQTDGQTAASYHGEHAPHAAQVAARTEPKVLIERPMLAQTLRVRVKPSGEVVQDFDVRRPADITAVNAPSMFGRLAVAVAAGVVVVILIFAVLQRISTLSTMTQAGSVQSANPTPTVVDPPATSTAQPGTPSVPAVDTGTTTARAPADTEPSASTAIASSAPRKTTPAAKPKTKAKPPSSPTKPTADDLGEFKAAF
jgi:hypothetical protein